MLVELKTNNRDNGASRFSLPHTFFHSSCLVSIVAISFIINLIMVDHANNAELMWLLLFSYNTTTTTTIKL